MNELKTKEITIVIPTIGRDILYNAVESAQAQRGSIVKEIIIVLDAKYKDVKLSLPPQNKSIPYRVLINDIGGVGANLNFAISSSTTKLISWLSDDDIYSEIKLLRQYNFLQKKHCTDEELDKLFLISSFELFNLETQTREIHDINWLAEFNSKFLAEYCLSKGLISGCTALFSKKLWHDVGGFPQEFRTTQDYVFWTRLIGRKPRFFVDSFAGMTSTVHPQMESKTLSEIHEFEKNTLQDYIFSIITSAKQLTNLSIAEQREVFYFPPSNTGLYTPFSSHENYNLTRLCEHELNLLKYCLIINSNDQKLNSTDAAMICHQVAVVLKEGIEKTAKFINEIPDPELGWFLDGYSYSTEGIEKICGFPFTYSIKFEQSIDDTVNFAIKRYRYLIIVDSDSLLINNNLNYFLEDLRKFDQSDSVQDALKTSHSSVIKLNDLGYQFIARNPFLDSEMTLNATD
ncbi:glycosyltransferase [Alcaligenaceae bacterium LF4-65]|uniref:Glycosyltransferase n=1 Tax=Zwartia hollandica TaxID=324606 RepID=A0A953T245_9BURK|nr:glycosyltransferase [Zwartia hollandica]MBZ1351033.1 glycosyltransferase [Zwartia hollandica]